MYRTLNPDKIVETAEALHQRASARSPGAGLTRVAAELLTIARGSAVTYRWLSKPNWTLRIVGGIGIVVLLAVVAGGMAKLRINLAVPSIPELLQGLEAGINEIVFFSIAVFFLLTLERRLKRRRALKAIHELRSIAHIIDMHQLTKDPERLTSPELRTPASPTRNLTPFQLTRYLDYCSEMLSVISKIAALYVQRFDDPVTLTAVNEVEQLTSGLSRKIWQKIIILDRIIAPGDGASAGGFR